MVLSGDGRRLALAADDSEVSVYDISTGGATRVHANSPLRDPEIALNRDGSLLAIVPEVAKSGRVLLRAIRGAEPMRTITARDVDRMALSEDGRWIATSESDSDGPHRVQVYRADDGREVFREDVVGEVISLRFLEGGRLAAQMMRGGTARGTAVTIWTWSPETLIAEVDRRIKDSLTVAERNDLMGTME
jgi:hypothetical protein